MGIVGCRHTPKITLSAPFLLWLFMHQCLVAAQQIGVSLAQVDRGLAQAHQEIQERALAEAAPDQGATFYFTVKNGEDEG
jgi:hypothetical protein